MKSKIAGLGLAAAAVAATVVPGSSAKAAAYGANFQVSITYQNVGAASTSTQFDFYPEANGAPVTFVGPTLAKDASGSLLVGSVSGVAAGFKGSAVLSANQPVVATIVQLADQATTGISNRLLSNGFTPADAANRQLVPTVLKNTFGATTYFSAQNVESFPINIRVEFFRVGEGTAAYTATQNNLPANAAKYFDAGQITQLGDTFNGSAVVTATPTDGSSAVARTVVTINELHTAANSVPNGGKSFEGTAKPSANIFMASAQCAAFASARFPGGQNSNYAVQNTSATEDIEFVVDFKSSRTGGQSVTSRTYTVVRNGKQSVRTCDTMAAGDYGSATIRVTKGSGALVAIGKVDGNGNTTAFLGQSTGASRLATPYVRWAKQQYYDSGQRYRSNLAIQNVGQAGATNVRVRYVDRAGTTLGTHQIGNVAAGAKVSSNPSLAPGALDACGRFGEYGGGQNGDPCLGNQFGGGAIIESDSGSLIAVVRVELSGPNPAGEDYSALSIANATQQ